MVLDHSDLEEQIRRVGKKREGLKLISFTRLVRLKEEVEEVEGMVEAVGTEGTNTLQLVSSTHHRDKRSEKDQYRD